MEAALELTYDCNLACIFCNKAVSTRGPNLMVDDWQRIIAELAELGCRSVRVTGGEPTTSPAFEPVVTAAAARGIDVIVETNGTRFGSELACRLANAARPTIRILLFSVRPAVHDAITGTVGSHASALAAVEFCRAAGLEVTAHTHLIRQNVEELPALEDWARGRGLRLTTSLTTYPRFDGDREPLRHAVKAPETIRRRLEHHAEEGERDLPACTDRLAIAPDGHVYPWVDVPLPVDHVRGRTLRQVWSEAPSPETLRMRATSRRDLQRMSRCAVPECRRPIGISAALRRDFRQVAGAACAQCPHQDALRRRTEANAELTVERIEALAAEGRIDEVATALAAGHYVVVRAASEALATIGDAVVVEALRGVFEHPDAETRWAAEMALAPIRTPEAVALMDSVFDKAGGRGRAMRLVGFDHEPVEPAVGIELAPGACRGPGIVPLVHVPACAFLMGSPVGEPGRHADEALREVEITRPFLVGATPVTQAQWVEVMGPNDFYFPGHADRPAERLDWFKAILFCNRLSELEGLRPCYSGPRGDIRWDRSAPGYRLLTEAEWECAARGGTPTAFPAGGITNPGAPGPGCLLRKTHAPLARPAEAPEAAQEIWHTDASGAAEHPVAAHDGGEDAVLDHIGWYRHNSGETTHPVGAKAPNAFGLFDAHGNVFEWVWDWYAPRTPGPRLVDPAGATSGEGRILRGGSWYNLPGHCRSAYRYDYTPDVRCFFVGLRVARSV